MTDLRTLVEALKREVAVPGTFEDVFPDTDDDALAATLADAFAQAQLQGFFGDITLAAEDGHYETSFDLSAAGGALIVLFAGMRMLRSSLRSVAQSFTYKAGSVEYSGSNMTSVIKDDLRALNDRLNDLIVQGRRSGRSVSVIDGYAGKLSAYPSLGGFYAYEFRG